MADQNNFLEFEDELPVLRSTTLVQRLQAPRKVGDLEEMFSPRYFFNQEEKEILAKAFFIETMGNAHFEFGAVPKTLRDFKERAQTGEIVAQTYTATIQADSWEIQREGYLQQADVSFYLLGTPEANERAKKIINSDARLSGQHDRDLHLQEATKLHDLLSPKKTKTEGWLELNNGFFFSANYDMFASTAQFLGVKHNIAPPKLEPTC